MEDVLGKLDRLWKSQCQNRHNYQQRYQSISNVFVCLLLFWEETHLTKMEHGFQRDAF